MHAFRLQVFAFVGAMVVIGASMGRGIEPTASATSPEAEAKRDTPETALVRARAMHEVYAESLDVIHHHYFRQERAVLPARAFEDVFDRIDERSGVKARWISVNTPPMSIDHEPANEFEKQAARAIAAGKSEFSQVAEGRLHWAGPILLGSNCVGCHTQASPNLGKDRAQRFAGLVLSIPLAEKSPEEGK